MRLEDVYETRRGRSDYNGSSEERYYLNRKKPIHPLYALLLAGAALFLFMWVIYVCVPTPTPSQEQKLLKTSQSLRDQMQACEKVMSHCHVLILKNGTPTVYGRP